MAITLPELLAAIDAELPAAVELRRRLHAEPELAWAERRTCDSIVEALGMPDVRRFDPTGLALRIGVEHRPAVVVRAELDGLPLREATGAAFASTNGAMHACGHDIHMAALVCLSRALRGLHAVADAPFVALWQPSEETGPSGAEAMLEQTAEIGRVGAIGAVHVHPELPAGTVSAAPGVVNASCDDIEIRVQGAGTHSAYPHRGRDPVLALASIIVTLQQVVSRRTDPIHGAVVSIGHLHAAGSHNVIPGEAAALGTLRATSAEARLALRDAVREVVEHVAAAHGCSGAVRVSPGEPPLLNDATLAARHADLLGQAGLMPADRFASFGSDDFAFYSAWGPLLMQFVGVRGTQAVADVPLHDPRFLPGDGAVRAVAACAAAFYIAAAGHGRQPV